MQNFITRTNRQQTTFTTLEDQVSAGNAVRLIDAFVDKLETGKLGFYKTMVKAEGWLYVVCCPCPPGVLVLSIQLKKMGGCVPPVVP